MDVVVTGASGFIGHAIAREAHARGHRVTALHRSGPPPHAANVAWETFDAWEAGETRDARSNRADVVIHAAAVRHRHGIAPEEYGRVNVALTDRVLGRAARDGARVVLVSSIAVYGWPAELPIDESRDYAPVGPYGASKVETEARVAASGLPFVIVQPSITYGPGDTNGMIDKMARMIARGFFVVPGRGRARVQLVYVDDVARLVMRAASSKVALGQRFICTYREPIAVADLVQRIARAAGTHIPRFGPPTALLRMAGFGMEQLERAGVFRGREPPLTREKLATLAVDRAYRADRMKALLGDEARVGYEEGITRTVRALGLGRRAD